MMMIIRNFFTYIPFAALVIVLFAFVRRCGFRVRAQAIWTMVLLLACSKFFCFRYLGGNAFCPEFPAALVLGWDFLYSGMIILTLLSVLAYFWKGRAKPVVLPVLAWVLAAYGLYEGVKPPRVREIELAYPNLPAELDGYRIAQVSDIHCSCAARRWRTQVVVDLVNAQKPDLICLLGDNVDGYSYDRRDDIAPLADLKARDGVWAVTGNHEFYYDTFGWQCVYEELGIRFLANECVFPRARLALGGVNDFASHKIKAPAPSVKTAFTAATNGEFRILMQHQPRMAQANLDGHHVDLQLSGHTHGGIIPLMYPIVRKSNRGFLRGVYDRDGRKVCISNGAGFWPGFPVRYFTPSEIVVITLRK